MNYIKKSEKAIKKAEQYAADPDRAHVWIEIAKRWHYLGEAVIRGELGSRKSK